MQKESREIEIETLKTPKGDVVTIKGLQTAIDSVYKEVASLDQHLAQINQSLNQISMNLSDYTQKIDTIGKSLADLIVFLSKVESQQKKSQDFIKRQRNITETDLLALKEDLSKILETLHRTVAKSE